MRLGLFNNGEFMKPETTTKIVQRRKKIVSYITVEKEIRVCEVPYVLFGQAVRKLRKEKCMNQTELSKLVDRSRATITNIEIGRQRVLLGDVFSFAKALKVKPERLFQMVNQ